MKKYRPNIPDESVPTLEMALRYTLDNKTDLPESEKVRIERLLDGIQKHQFKQEFEDYLADKRAARTLQREQMLQTASELREAINKDRADEQQQEEDNHGEHRK